MDRERFDGLTRLFATTGSRRAALGALLGIVLLGQGRDVLTKNGKKGRNGDKGHDKGKGQAKAKAKRRAKQPRAQAVPAGCYPNTRCSVGRMKNANHCNFEHSTAFTPSKDLWKINLSGANLRHVNATGANLGDANLSNACLVDANFSGANLTRANLAGAIFCRTTLPNGTIENKGCDSPTHCCPTCATTDQCGAGEVCCAGTCRSGNCCTDTDCTAPGAVCEAGTCSAGCDVCPVGCPFTSLQAAVGAAPATGGTIRICPGTYTTVNVFINKSLTITGAGDGPGGTILDGLRAGRVLQISGATLAVRDLTITRGRNSAGGAIFTSGMLTLERVQVSDSDTPGTGSGGAILVFPGSTLILKGSRITNNTAANGFGGGINNQGTLTLDASRIEDNTAGEGGGIGNHGIVNLINGSTVGDVDPLKLKGNTATLGPGSGGGIWNGGMVTGASASSVVGNDPDNCVNKLGGTGC